jgi:hypothetical protein
MEEFRLYLYRVFWVACKLQRAKLLAWLGSTCRQYIRSLHQHEILPFCLVVGWTTMRLVRAFNFAKLLSKRRFSSG